MLSIARRAHSSKESLYTWFGSKEELLAALVVRQAEVTNVEVERALNGGRDVRTTLCAIAAGLFDLLLSPTSLALNRAAMTSPDLARILLQHGRHRTGPLIEGYMAQLDGISITDPATSFTVFYGLVVRDWQIRALLGERPPSAAARSQQTTAAVDMFLSLHNARL